MLGVCDVWWVCFLGGGFGFVHLLLLRRLRFCSSSSASSSSSSSSLSASSSSSSSSLSSFVMILVGGWEGGEKEGGAGRFWVLWGSGGFEGFERCDCLYLVGGVWCFSVLVGAYGVLG